MDARELVHAAPSLVKHLPADAIDLVVEHVEKGRLAGRWTQTIKTQRVRDDGHLEKSMKTITLWLRPNFEAQYASRQTWTSYRGRHRFSGKFGGGSSKETIEQPIFPSAANNETFLSHPSQPAAGTWTVTGTGETETLTLQGSGHFSAGAVEDDDLLYSGGGPKKNVSFSVLVSDLRANFKHTPMPKEAAAVANSRVMNGGGSTSTDADAANEDRLRLAKSVSNWKRDRHTPWRRAFWGMGAAYKCSSQCAVM